MAICLKKSWISSRLIIIDPSYSRLSLTTVGSYILLSVDLVDRSIWLNGATDPLEDVIIKLAVGLILLCLSFKWRTIKSDNSMFFSVRLRALPPRADCSTILSRIEISINFWRLIWVEWDYIMCLRLLLVRSMTSYWQIVWSSFFLKFRSVPLFGAFSVLYLA